LLDFWSIVMQTCLLDTQLHIFRMVEEVNGIFTSIASDGDECIQQGDPVRVTLLDTWMPSAGPIRARIDSLMLISLKSSVVQVER
jgi:hypothetical protein